MATSLWLVVKWPILLTVSIGVKRLQQWVNIQSTSEHNKVSLTEINTLLLLIHECSALAIVIRSPSSDLIRLNKLAFSRRPFSDSSFPRVYIIAQTAYMWKRKRASPLLSLCYFEEAISKYMSSECTFLGGREFIIMTKIWNETKHIVLNFVTVFGIQ